MLVNSNSLTGNSKSLFGSPNTLFGNSNNLPSNSNGLFSNSNNTPILFGNSNNIIESRQLQPLIQIPFKNKNLLTQYLTNERNLTSLTNEKLLQYIKDTSIKCEYCNETCPYVCIQQKCQRKGLICPNCNNFNTEDVQAKHFNHNYTFIFPLFMKSISQFNYKPFDKFKQMVDQVIQNLQVLLEKYQDIAKFIRNIDHRIKDQQAKSKQYEKEYVFNFFESKIQQNTIENLIKGININFHKNAQSELNQIFSLTKIIQDQNKKTLEIFKNYQIQRQQMQKYLSTYAEFKPFQKGNQPYSYQQNEGQQNLFEKYILDDFRSYALSMNLPLNNPVDECIYLSNLGRFQHIKKLTLHTNSIFHLAAILRLRNLDELHVILLNDKSDNVKCDYYGIDQSCSWNCLRKISLIGVNSNYFKFINLLLKSKYVQQIKCELNINDTADKKSMTQFFTQIVSNNLYKFSLKITNKIKNQYSLQKQFINIVWRLAQSPNLIFLQIQGIDWKFIPFYNTVSVRCFFLLNWKLSNSVIKTQTDIKFINQTEVNLLKKKKIAFMLVLSYKFKIFERSMINMCFDKVVIA